MNMSEINTPGLMLENFLKFAKEYLNLSKLPKIQFKETATEVNSFGYYDVKTDQIVIATSNRHPMDIFRTLAHELTHHSQRINNKINNKSGETGSPQENEANAKAGMLMREFSLKYPEYI
jgi:Zn-dependent peptidase ImmA (M78 family)